MTQEPPAKMRRLDSVYKDTNGVPRQNGRLTHIGLSDGELANRVLVVGHPKRAELIAGFFEKGGELKLESDRGFTTYTGYLPGRKERLSVVSCGMGLAMMDFFVREARNVVEGPMVVVRFGTCGGLQERADAGSIAVASEGSILVQRNVDYFNSEGEPAKSAAPYLISDVCASDPELSAAVVAELRKELGDDKVHACMNATADSFYGSQGRRDPNFADDNDELISDVLCRRPEVISMEMETFQLLHMARSGRPKGSIRATAASIVVANRETEDVVDHATLQATEKSGGVAILRALAGMPLEEVDG